MPSTTPRERTISEYRSTIASVLEPHADEADDARVGTFLALSIGRVMLNEAVRAGVVPHIHDDTIHHIKDWLSAAIINDALWISDCDPAGRPKKLMKFSTVAGVTQEADKAMLKASQRMGDTPLSEEGEVLFARLDDDFRLIQLLSPAALDRESGAMQHCIGEGAYDRNLRDGNHIYLSLRDRHNKPHATLEIKGGRVKQLQGKQNKPPVKRYLDLLIRYLERERHAVDIRPRVLGHVVDMDGKWHGLDDLPDGLSIAGDLDMSGTNVRHLPDNLTVGQNLQLFDTGIRSLPRNLVIGGGLFLRETVITTIPDCLIVRGKLDAYRSALSSLPAGFHVNGHLNLGLTPILSLPSGLKVDGNLILCQTGISTLPEDLQVSGCLDLRGTDIKHLPTGIDDTIDIRCDHDGDELWVTAAEFRTMKKDGSRIPGLLTMADVRAARATSSNATSARP